VPGYTGCANVNFVRQVFLKVIVWQTYRRTDRIDRKYKRRRFAGGR